MTNKQRKVLDRLREWRDSGKTTNVDILELLEIIDSLELELEKTSNVPVGMDQVVRIRDEESMLPKGRTFPSRRPDHEC